MTLVWPLDGPLDSPENSVQGKGLYHTRGVALTRTGCAGHAPPVTHRPWRSAWRCHFSHPGLPHLGQGAKAPRHPMGQHRGERTGDDRRLGATREARGTTRNLPRDHRREQRVRGCVGREVREDAGVLPAGRGRRARSRFSSSHCGAGLRVAQRTDLSDRPKTRGLKDKGQLRPFTSHASGKLQGGPPDIRCTGNAGAWSGVRSPSRSSHTGVCISACHFAKRPFRDAGE